MFQFVIAILAGLLTVASPCVLPILPIVLGVSFGHKNPLRPLFIVFGFVISFTLAAILLAFLTEGAGLDANLVRTIGIIVLAVFGVLLLLPSLYEKIIIKLTPFLFRISNTGAVAKTGNLSGFLLGVTLGIVWTPCAGPILASILTLVVLQQNLLSAGILLFFYSVGAAIPMLLIAYGGQYIGRGVKSIAPYTPLLQKIFGVIIILLAFAMYFNYDTKIYSIILQYYPTFNPKL